MAEIFAAVASGAGLASLAIQLLESSQKLKGLYDASRDAPRTVTDLCFELETLSLQLRQLERHRQHDRLDTELLDRCIATCQHRTERVESVVDEMARYLSRFTRFGRMYTAFKEPEMRGLLEQLESAKNSLSLAYITYCQYVAITLGIKDAHELERLDLGAYGIQAARPKFYNVRMSSLQCSKCSSAPSKTLCITGRSELLTS